MPGLLDADRWARLNAELAGDGLAIVFEALPFGCLAHEHAACQRCFVPHIHDDLRNPLDEKVERHDVRKESEREQDGDLRQTGLKQCSNTRVAGLLRRAGVKTARQSNQDSRTEAIVPPTTTPIG